MPSDSYRGLKFIDLRETLIHGDYSSTEIPFEKRLALFLPAHIHPRSSNNSNVSQSGIILGSTGEKMRGDNRGNEDDGTASIPGLQPLPQIAGELEHIEPAMTEHAGISSGELSNILDFGDRNEWNSLDSLDLFLMSSS